MSEANKAEPVDIFSMSDEDLLKLDPSTLVDEPAAASTEGTEGEQGTAADDTGTTDNEPNSPDDSGQAGESAVGDGGAGDPHQEGEAGSAGQGGEEVAGDAGAKATDAAAAGQAAQPGAENAAEGNKVEDKAGEAGEAAFNYEAEYKKLLAPFNANGKEMSVKNVEEAVTLMQMGANYNKKMAALAPNLKIVKLLESHGLTDPEKISYLIDLANKDAGAINKLVKDSGIDPMDLSAEKADGYKPAARNVNDKELELDSVLEEIQETPTYQRTLGVVGKDWDSNSRQVVADNPQLLKVINDHIQRGVFDVIKAEVDRERTFGRLRGLSDIEAYRQVGDALQARNGFDHLSRPASANAGTQGQQAPAAAPRIIQPKPKQAVDETKLNEQRKAAGSSKPAGSSSGVPADFNPLAMSDEDFLKTVKPNFL